jgi:hypothetical protein
MPLSKQTTAVANAAGTAVASIGPNLYGEAWDVNNVMVQNATPVTSANTPQAIMQAAGVPIAGTFSGVQDNADPGAHLRQGQVVKVTWTQCDPATLCTLTVYGTRTIQGG